MVESVNQKLRLQARKAWWLMPFRPRQTLRARLRVSRRRPWLLLGALVGTAQLCNAPFLYADVGPTPRDVISWLIIIGPLAGWILASILGPLISKLGRTLFRGEGDAADCRTAFLWGCLPLVYSLAVWIPAILFSWGPAWLNTLVAIRPIAAILTLWTAWTLSMAVAEAHGLRGAQGFAIVVLTFSLISLPLSFFAFPRV